MEHVCMCALSDSVWLTLFFCKNLTKSDNFQDNSIILSFFEKYLKRDCYTNQYQQLSLKFFSKSHIFAKIFPYASEVSQTMSTFQM